MTARTRKKVAATLLRLASLDLKKACCMPHNLLGLTNKKWKNAIMQPSNWEPSGVVMLLGEKHFQMMF